MTRIKHNKSGGRVVSLMSDRATPATSRPRKKSGSKSGPVTTNQPKAAKPEPTCCGLVLPKSRICSVCS
jgi:hypothetical protein